ncbi:MAG TPA: NnrS family protein, partial [Polyangiaceae bacterium]|nr:NnrS family protein [Polyangiaceae bacterium]
AALFAANLVVHLDGLGVLPPGSARYANLVSVDVIVLLIMVIGGRVFPVFTRNATGVASIRNIPWLDRASVIAMVALVLVDASMPNAVRLGAILAGLVGILAAARAVHWGARHSWRDPLVWVLHAGYGWLVVGLLLRGTAGVLGWPFGSVATHALTVGAIGTLTLGMMARVSLGHTGRMLVAPGPMTAAFVGITLAAFARVLVPWVSPEHYTVGLFAAGAFWVLAFVVFLLAYAKILWRPRMDGRPG